MRSIAAQIFTTKCLVDGEPMVTLCPEMKHSKDFLRIVQMIEK